MSDQSWKWLYSFVVLGLTVFWAWFCLTTVNHTMQNPTGGNIIETSGASALMGALIVWNGNINQHWFRKKSPPTPPAPPAV